VAPPLATQADPIRSREVARGLACRSRVGANSPGEWHGPTFTPAGAWTFERKWSPRAILGCTASRNRPPARRPRSNRQPPWPARAGRFSGLRACRHDAGAYRPSLPSPGTSANDGVRSRLPLRGSPRFALGSLLSPAVKPDTNTVLTMSSWAGDCQLRLKNAFPSAPIFRTARGCSFRAAFSPMEERAGMA